MYFPQKIERVFMKNRKINYSNHYDVICQIFSVCVKNISLFKLTIHESK